MIYLASPYSSGHKIIGSEKDMMLETRYREVEGAMVVLITREIMVYSPILHHHYLAQRYHMPKDFNFWKSRDFHFIDLSTMFLILQLKDWEKSEGVAEELGYAQHKDKPVRYANLKEIHSWTTYLAGEEITFRETP